MNTIRYPYHLIFLLVFCAVLLPENVSSQKSELGRFPVYNFTPKDYGALEQNWCAVQDHRGIMYFGNNHGVLEYDGENWTLIPEETGSPVKSMTVDENGRVYFGSINEFGYLEADSVGRMDYYMLSDRLPDEHKNFNEIWKTHSTEDGIIFQSYNYLFIWNGDSIRVIYSEERIHESFYIAGILFISLMDSGIAYLEEGNIKPFSAGDLFSEIYIYGMLEKESGKVLIITDSDGFFEMSLDNSNVANSGIRKLATGNDNLFSSIEIFNAQKISHNRISLGTWGYGLIIVDSLYNVVAVIDKESQLQDQIIQGQFVDATGNLWLALSSGISRVESHSALTQFSDTEGIMGTIQAITRFNGKIYITSNGGLFYMDHNYYNRDLGRFQKPVFRQTTDVDIECWNMITFINGQDEVLLAATNTDVFELTKDHGYTKVLEGVVYMLYQSKLDPNRVFVGLESGLTSIYRVNGKWEQEGYIDGIDETISNISEDHMGNVWMGTPEINVLKLYIQNFDGHKIDQYTVTRYNEENGLPRGPFIFSQLKGPPTVATNKGLYKFNLIEESFKPDSSYGDQFGDGSLYIHRISEYKEPEIWMETFAQGAKEFQHRVGYLKESEPNEYTWISEPFNHLSEVPIHAIYQEKGGIVWLGGSQGLFRYQMDITRDYHLDYNAYIRTVVPSEGGLSFGGTYMDVNNIPSLAQPELLKLSYPYRNNSLVFNFAAQPGFAETFTRYSYFLEGNDRDWSEWTEEDYRPYTNLREGKYIFRVKAKNVHGHVSREATYEFTILAPWYRKLWAYILYIIIAAVIVYTIVKVYTRQLREIIRERTAEVVAQKEVIEEKNKDIMDSIQYAKKIQEALLPPEDDLGKLDLDGFILFLPRDVVSGDFYWLAKHDGKIITVSADCTGHGVPGAFMSMLGVAFLNNIVGAQGITKSHEILNELRAEVIAALKQKGHEGEQKDGMDLALHVIDYEKMTIDFSGANNPLILIRDNELNQIKGDRMPIGIHELADQSFVNHELEAIKGDVLYTFSDGYQDQFGGPKNKKFMIKKMKELMLEIHQKPMDQQKTIFEKAFYDWIVPYDAEQVDDVILIGIRI